MLVYLLLWKDGRQAPRKCLLELGAVTKRWVKRKVEGEDLGDGNREGIGRPQQVFCYRTGGRIGRLDLEERRELAH